MKMKNNNKVTFQGHKYRRAKVLSKWNSIIRFYEDNGAKKTVEQFKISRGSLYYIIKEMNKTV